MPRDLGMDNRSSLGHDGSPELRRLKWLAVLAPVIFLGAIEVARAVVPPLFAGWPGYVLLGFVVLVAILLFAEAVFTVVARVQHRASRRNQELLALHEAGLGILGELDLEVVLQNVVDQARDLVGARYGALSLVRPEGGIEAFLTSGISNAERARIGPIPVGHGLLAVVLSEGQRLRLPDLTRDPRSVGFPPHHPPMHSLLAGPILADDGIVGNLYLAEKEQAVEFDLDDQETLARFATQAALVIDNARLHRRVRALAITEERTRLAREMHDSLAQMLGYVNTKAQAAQEYLRGGQPDRAGEQIGQLADAARTAYADVREGILGLRTAPELDEAFLDTVARFLERWEAQSGVTVRFAHPPESDGRVQISSLAEVQLLRIIQEALTNVRKHAAATHAEVAIHRINGSIEVLIADNGRGYEPDGPPRSAFPRFGLTTMRERAEAVGGTFAIGPREGGGTRVAVRLPADQPRFVGGETRERAHR